MTKPQVEPEKIHFKGLRILKSHFETDINAPDLPDVSRFTVGLKSETGFNREENGVRFRLFVKIKGFDKSQEPVNVFGEYSLEFHFIVENLDDFITEGSDDKEDFTVSAMIGATLAGIAYSTTRGIILDRTQSTDFKGVLLPVINPQQLLSNDSYSTL